MVENHKARTMFVGACKLDLFVHLLFLNTFAFLNYNYTRENDLVVWPYWMLFAIIFILAIGNNIHGYFVMRTTASTLNSRMYFVERTFVQILEIYLAFTFGFNCDLLFQKQLEIQTADYAYIRQL